MKLVLLHIKYEFDGLLVSINQLQAGGSVCLFSSYTGGVRFPNIIMKDK